MKKFAIAFIIALLALAVIAGPALAYDPDGANAEVTCDEVGVTDDGPAVGTTIVFYGTVHVDASSYNNNNYGDGYSHSEHSWYTTGVYASVDGSAYYVVYAPDGTIVAGNSASWSDSEVGDTGYFIIWPSDEDVSAGVSEDWSWEAPVYVDQVGDYVAENGGEANAEYGHWVQYGHYEGHGCNKHFVPDGDPIFFVDGDPAYEACMTQRTVTSHSAGQFLLTAVHPMLTIQLPAPLWIQRDEHDAHFRGYQGWGNPTTKDIVYSDGIWQVEIPAGTSILMDGEWHKLTTIEIDDQGNVIGRYGSDGHKTATDISLSQAIIITKVGE